MGPKIFVLPQNERFIVLGVVLLLWLVIRGVQYWAARSQTPSAGGTLRDYGIGGGTICPKCQRPFALNLIGIKVGFGTKLARCPYCGKWSIVRRRSIDELRAAEDAERAESSPVHEKTEAEMQKDRLDNSRYTEK